ncbi:hypothetical protein SSPO_093200 [Streptomyces antimycoticus]|uniref:Secreted protein n=1 Tax=Streptomyces antimycoticus TaxID=68175 RepID=A0A499UZH1_9ACTN|nr:hypothetical protein SSPO_093200 [Streptomyces antimycoticus]
MTRKRTLSGKKKLGLMVGALALAGTGAGVLAATSNASTDNAAQSSTACTGLDQALANNQKFIADQQANPDAQSEARIANRQAVIEEIKRKQQASGCAVDEAAGQGRRRPRPTAAPRPRLPPRLPPRTPAPTIPAPPARSSARGRPSPCPVRVGPRPPPAINSRSAPNSR